MQYHEFYIHAVIALIGLCLGSFINVLVFRLPKGTLFKEKRSHCPNCSEKLKTYDLLPVVSYLFLKGNCRYCKEKISIRYPLVELSAGIITLASYILLGFSGNFVVVSLILLILLTISLIDIEIMEIPHSLTIALIPLAIITYWTNTSIELIPRLIGIAVISVPLIILVLIFPGSFGGGDIKLMMIAGFILGWQNTILAFFLAVAASGVYIGYLAVKKQIARKLKIAFGPYLCIGITIAIFFGTDIIKAYLGWFGL